MFSMTHVLYPSSPTATTITLKKLDMPITQNQVIILKAQTIQNMKSFITTDYRSVVSKISTQLLYLVCIHTTFTTTQAIYIYHRMQKKAEAAFGNPVDSGEQRVF